MLLENKDVVDYFDYNYKGNDLKIPYHDILYIETTGVSHKLRIIGKNFMGQWRIFKKKIKIRKDFIPLINHFLSM